MIILRILAVGKVKTVKISNFWTFWPLIQLIQLLLTSGSTPFCPTVHRFKKCSDISEVTSGGRAEGANLKVYHFSSVTALFASIDH